MLELFIILGYIRNLSGTWNEHWACYWRSIIFGLCCEIEYIFDFRKIVIFLISRQLGGFKLPFFVLGSAMIILVPVNIFLLPVIDDGK